MIVAKHRASDMTAIEQQCAIYFFLFKQGVNFSEIFHGHDEENQVSWQIDFYQAPRQFGLNSYLLTFADLRTLSEETAPQVNTSKGQVKGKMQTMKFLLITAH